MPYGRGAVLTTRYLLLACTTHEPKTDSIRSQKQRLYGMGGWVHENERLCCVAVFRAILFPNL